MKPSGALSDAPAQCQRVHDVAHREPSNFEICGLRLAAGDLGRGGANQKWSKVRNNLVHPLVPLTPTAVVPNAGEPERGGAATTATATTAFCSSAVQRSGCPAI